VSTSLLVDTNLGAHQAIIYIYTAVVQTASGCLRMTLTNIERIAKAFKLSLSELFRGV
jgi:hypothetical protein